MTSWDRAARFYDLQLWLERTAIEAALELARVEPDDRLLDLGCGTGALLRRLAARAAAPREAIGADSSAAMLARVPPLPAGWSVVHADATRLPFGDDEFDVVTVVYLLHLLDRARRRAVLAEAARVLRPGGRLIAVTVAPPRSPRLRGWLERASRRRSLRGGVLAGLRPLDPRPDLEAGGFAVREAHRTARGYPSLIVSARIPDLR